MDLGKVMNECLKSTTCLFPGFNYINSMLIKYSSLYKTEVELMISAS